VHREPPVFSGKRVGKRVAPEMVLPVFVLVVAFFALLIAYPWFVLATGTLLYLGSLPFGLIAYRNFERQDAAAKAAEPSATSLPAAGTEAATSEATATPPTGASPDQDDRPPRLN
jgi:CDP-diacylglycerol--serine O-phosphatidyltransferase